MHDAHCVFEYQYRDAGNWKTWGSILLLGNLPENANAIIRSFLESEELFVAEQIGIKSLCPEHFSTYGGPSDLDHAFHEFYGLREATAGEVVTMEIFCSVDELILRLHSLGGEWDVKKSPNAWI